MNVATGLRKYSNLGCSIYWFPRKRMDYYIPYALTVYVPITHSLTPGIIKCHLLHKINVLEHWTSASLSSFLVFVSVTWGYVLFSVHLFPPCGQASSVM